MDQQKIGLFLKELRKENGVTQEQLAEKFHVSNRSVSRWENGYNMPDLDVLIEISDYYRVELREILDGERKGEKMDKETEETVIKAVDYANTEALHWNGRIHWLLSVGVILLAISLIIGHTPLVENEIWSAVESFSSGAACGLMIVGVIASSRFGMRLRAFKKRLLKRS